MAVTQNDVDAACAEIIAKNEKLTQRNVQKITGGSYSTIGPMLDDWKARQEEADELAAMSIPHVISERMSDAAAAIWKAATEAANEGHAAMREAIRDAKAETDAVRVEMSEVVADLEAQLAELRDERDSAVADAKQNSVQNVRLEEQLNSARAEIARADAARADADKRAADADARASASGKRFDELMKKLNSEK